MRSERTPLDTSRIEPKVRADLSGFDEPYEELAFIYQLFKTLWSGTAPVLTVGCTAGVEHAAVLGVSRHPSGSKERIRQVDRHVDISSRDWPDGGYEVVIIGSSRDAAVALNLFERLHTGTRLGSLFVLPDFASTSHAGVTAAVGMHADAFELVTRSETTFVYSRQASLTGRELEPTPAALELAFMSLKREASRRKDRALHDAHDAQSAHACAVEGSSSRRPGDARPEPAWLERLHRALGGIAPFQTTELDEIADIAAKAAAEGAANAARSMILDFLKSRPTAEASPRHVPALAGAAGALAGLGDTELSVQLLRKTLELAGRTQLPEDFETARAAARFLERLGVDDVAVLSLRRPHDDGFVRCLQTEDGSRTPLDLASIDAELARYLDEISSQTTLAERRLLYKFFKTVWACDGDVLELGPFLGGTTRAIAMGMADNPRCTRDRKLLTYDRFSHYCMNADQFDAWVAPVFASGLVAETMKTSLGADFDFKRLFDTIHRDQPYSDAVISRRGSLPIRPEDSAVLDEPFRIEPERKLSAVFVDGCKYWYSMKAFMTAVSSSTAPGTHFLFQDYSFTDCFFVPVFLAVMDDTFELVCYVDNTYVYRQRAPLTAQRIEQSFPDTIEAFSRARFDAVFERLHAEALERGDTRSVVIYALQHARVVSYLGDLEEAYRLVERAASEPRAVEYQWFIDFARRQPLMLPDGRFRSLAWYPDGARKTTSEYREVQRADGFTMSESDGIHRTWHPNGTLATETHYRAGVQHGPARAWDETGKLVSDDDYRDGSIDHQRPGLATIGVRG